MLSLFINLKYSFLKYLFIPPVALQCKVHPPFLLPRSGIGQFFLPSESSSLCCFSPPFSPSHSVPLSPIFQPPFSRNPVSHDQLAAVQIIVYIITVFFLHLEKEWKCWAACLWTEVGVNELQQQVSLFSTTFCPINVLSSL